MPRRYRHPRACGLALYTYVTLSVQRRTILFTFRTGNAVRSSSAPCTMSCDTRIESTNAGSTRHTFVHVRQMPCLCTADGSRTPRIHLGSNQLLRSSPWHPQTRQSRQAARAHDCLAKRMLRQRHSSKDRKRRAQGIRRRHTRSSTVSWARRCV